MLEALGWCLLITSTAALGSFVGARAWDYLPARIFVLTCVTLWLMYMSAYLREFTLDPTTAFLLSTLNIGGIAILALMLLLLFAGMFVPPWFEGRRPIIFISAPYLLASLILLADAITGSGFIIAGVRMTETGFRPVFANPGASILLAIFVLSWLPHIGVLGFAAIRQPHVRKSIGLLIAVMVGSVITSFFGAGGVIQSLIILCVFAYTVLRVRLLLPTRAGVDTAVHAMDDGIVIRDPYGALTFANSAARQFGLHTAEILAGIVATTTDQLVRVGDHTLFVRRQILEAPSGTPIGELLLARDVTVLKQREQQLEAEQTRLLETIAQLTEAQQERATLSQTVQQLAMPVIPVLPGILIVPLIGFVNQDRINQLHTTVLASIERTQAHLVLLDLTGVPTLDRVGGAGLVRIVRSTKLLGARCVLVGIQPETAQSLISLDNTLDGIETLATLEQAVQTMVAQPSEMRDQHVAYG